MNREPPAAVRAALAEEVGFGCPVDGCGSPYLTWHHFDPPWGVREHHEPEGMIALCRDHHPEADAQAFTEDELRELKRTGRDKDRLLGARLNWMREQLLIRVGGVFYYETPIAVRIGDTPIVWFRRNENNRVLVNLSMPSASGEPRLEMRDNFWLTEGANLRVLNCPPSGRVIQARYSNDDMLRIEFRNIASLEELDRRYQTRAPKPKRRAGHRSPPIARGPTSHASPVAKNGITFPIAVAEITMRLPGTGLQFSANKTGVAGGAIYGGWMSHSAVGIQIGPSSSEGVPSPSAAGSTDPVGGA
jgi:hypothetical protein